MVKLTRLKDVRQRKALTQQQLADRAGVNRVTIARIETGRDEPFPTTLRKVADALGVEPEELVDAPAQPAPHSVADGSVTLLALDPRITVADPEDVSRLLQAEPDLLPLVNEAAEQLFRYIPDVRLMLKVLVDPEYVGEELFLAATTDLPEDEALDALDRFDREWWFDHGRRSSGLLLVDLS